MTSDERDKALLGAVILAGSAYVLSQLGRAGGWPWDWDLWNRNPGTDKGGPDDPQKPRKPGEAPGDGPSAQKPATGPTRPGPRVIDVYDPAIRLPDGRVVSGATYRRMLNEGYRP